MEGKTQLVPEGEHKVRLTFIGLEKSQHSGQPQIVLQFVDDAERKISKWLNADCATEKQANYVGSQLRNLVASGGTPNISVTTREYQGKRKPEVFIQPKDYQPNRQEGGIEYLAKRFDATEVPTPASDEQIPF